MTYSYQGVSTSDLGRDAAHVLVELCSRVRADQGPQRVTQQQREALTRSRAFLTDWSEAMEADFKPLSRNGRNGTRK